MIVKTRSNRNARLEHARFWLHDLVCVGVGTYCVDDRRKDHARRTQHARARAIVDGDYMSLMEEVHDLLHPTCTRSVVGHYNFEHPRLVAFAESLGITPMKAPAN